MCAPLHTASPKRSPPIPAVPCLQPIGELVDGDGSIIHVNDKKLVAGEAPHSCSPYHRPGHLPACISHPKGSHGGAELIHFDDKKPVAGEASRPWPQSV